MLQQTCPCCSNKPFKQCCGPYLQGLATAKTVQQLMRSRYSAYALGGHGAYLLASWHPDSRPLLSAAALSVRELHWQNLQVLDYWQQGNRGTVEFIATFTRADASVADDRVVGDRVVGDRAADKVAETHHERSRFVRVAGKWLYVDGNQESSETI